MFQNLKIFPLLVLALFSLGFIAISYIPAIQSLALSPLVIAIFIGIFLGNFFGKFFPTQWSPSVIFATKQLLRLGIILYGFKITVGEIFAVGAEGIMMAIIMLVSTFFLALFIGQKILKLDRDTSILVGAGASICGAAAVLATESTLKNSPEKTSLAIATVVVFGTISMFVIPILFQSQVFSLNDKQIGVYIGATVHEVAQVVGAGNMISETTAENAVIVKMTRVIFLVPFLFFLGLFIYKSTTAQKNSSTLKKNTVSIFSLLPGFAVLFLVAIGINSLIAIPENFSRMIDWIDTFLLTIAMFALGLETNIKKFKKIGGKAFLLAGILFAWLIVGGYGIIRIYAAYFLNIT